MRRLLLFFALLLPAPAWATWSAPTQAVFNNACAASTSCAVTVSAIGAAHLLVIPWHTGNFAILSSVTIAGETVVVPGSSGQPNSCGYNANPSAGCGYVLKSVGGATTVTCNWSQTATASNTTCGLYEVAYSAPRAFIETNFFHESHASASTFAGANFANNFPTYINGTNDIIFQFANVSTGTVSSISSSFVLDNNIGQVADAHLLNTYSNTAPTWTNSIAATSEVFGIAFGEDYNPNTAGLIPATTPNSGLQLSWSGGVGTRIVTVTSPGLFQLGFDEGDAWGIAQWYDLVNDPGATTNLLGPAYPAGGADITIAEPGLFQRTYYDAIPVGDTKQFCRSSHYYFPNSPRQLSILEYNSFRVVIETKSEPTVTAQGVLSNLIGTARYYIYPNGQVYVHYVATVTNGVTFTAGSIFSDVTLEDPTQTGTSPPDTKGWIRASSSQNPFSTYGVSDPYIFAYWGSSTPAPNTNYTRASILLVRSPNNLYDGNEINHSWGSGPGHGVIRWGWYNPPGNIVLGDGGALTEDMLIQLGTQGSTVLPNITSSTVAGPIATAYIANPTPPLPSSQAILNLSPAVVNQGTTMTFTATDPGTWACAGTDSTGGATTCAGSINSGSGVYTAPASVTAKRSLGGFQLLPNNHIINTNISGLAASTIAKTSYVIGGSAIVRAGNVVTVTLTSGQTYYTGQSVVIAGVTDASFNGTFTTASGGLNTLTYAQVAGNATSGSGTATFDWMSWLIAGSPSGNPNYEPGQPLNYVTPSTPTVNLAFNYTSGNNGLFRIPVYPNINIQGGWFSARTSQNADHHLQTINTTTGAFQEQYQYYCELPTTAASVTANVATITFGSSPLDCGFRNGRTVGVGGFTGGDTYFNSAVVITTTTGTTISFPLVHANASASTNGTVSYNTACVTCNSQSGIIYSNVDYALPVNGATDAAGTELMPLELNLQEWEQAVATTGTINHALRMTIGLGFECSCSIWPATAFATDGGFLPFGARARLKSSYPISGFSAIAQVLLKQLQQYGLINADGGTMWNIDGQGTNWPQAYRQAMFDVRAANLASNMEFVDESGLMISATSGLTNRNREIATFTRTSDSTTASVDVALQGVAVNLPQDYLNIQVGAPAQQFTALVNIGSVTWTMSPSVGTLTSGGLYTPPGSVASPTTTTVTATSSTNGTVAAQMIVTVLPAGTIRFIPGSIPGATLGLTTPTSYVDTGANVWYATGDNGGYSADNCIPTGSANPTLYRYEFGTWPDPNDLRFDLIVPNANYQIIYKNSATFGVAGTELVNLEANGVTFANNFDIYVASGGSCKAYDLLSPTVTVTDNRLSFVARVINLGAHVTALSINQGTTPTGGTITPNGKVTSGVSIK